MYGNLLTGLMYYRKQFYAKKLPHWTSKENGIKTGEVGQVETTFLIRKRWSQGSILQGTQAGGLCSMPVF